MDKFNFVRDGGSKLPPGFRFQPTDEEIVFQYLARKVFSCRLPASVIPEIDDIFGFGHPLELPGDSEQDRYFFSSNHLNFSRMVGRATCGGYWKFTGSDKQIGCSKRMPIVGIRKTLVFYKGKHPCATRTDWFMHLYYIALSAGNASSKSQYQKRHSHEASLVQIGKWVLCHVHLKERRSKVGVSDNGWHRRHFMTANISDQTDSSSSSDSIEVSSTTADE